jgi:succinate dehydrogenase/fumarate reductase flavoprotein subunit
MPLNNEEDPNMSNSDRRTFLKNVGQGTLAAGFGWGLPEGGWITADDAASAQNSNLTRENRLEADVLVVGGGFAAIFAAIKASEQGARVVMVDKGWVGRSGQSPLAGGHVVFNPASDKINEWMDFTNKATEYVNKRDWCEIIFKDSYARFQDLLSWGAEFKKDQNGEIISSGQLFTMADEINCARFDVFDLEKNEMTVLRKQVVKSGVKLLDRVMVTELLKQNGRVVGAVGMSVDSDDLYTFLAKATILCVGHCGYKPAGYPALVQLTGDGEAMAYRAGAEILGKEYSDTHTTSMEYASLCGRVRLPDNLEPRLGREEVLLKHGMFDTLMNAEGNKVGARPPGASNYKFSYLLMEFEAHAGRAPINWATEGLHMEITGAACLGMSHRNADGLWPADTNCSSSMPGLYAAGDSLGTMVNGAVYTVGGSSSMGAMVTGARAGAAAAKEVLKMGKSAVDENEIQRAKRFIYAPKERKGGYSPRWVTQLLQNTMMPYFILYIKRADRLQAALTQVEFMQEQLVPGLFARDPHELRLAHETRNMVLSAEMRLRSSLFRTESRGNHYREDNPRRDDPNWLAWTKIKQEQGKMKLIKVPIPTEWWPDLTIPYEKRYPMRFPNEKI